MQRRKILYSLLYDRLLSMDYICKAMQVAYITLFQGKAALSNHLARNFIPFSHSFD